MVGMRLSLLVGTDGQMHGVEGKRLLVQHRQLVCALVFPAGNVGEVLVIALGFAVGQLVFKTELTRKASNYDTIPTFPDAF